MRAKRLFLFKNANVNYLQNAKFSLILDIFETGKQSLIYFQQDVKRKFWDS